MSFYNTIMKKILLSGAFFNEWTFKYEKQNIYCSHLSKSCSVVGYKFGMIKLLYYVYEVN